MPLFHLPWHPKTDVYIVLQVGLSVQVYLLDLVLYLHRVDQVSHG